MRNLTVILSVVALAGAVAAGVLFILIGNSKQRLHQQLVAAELRGTQLTESLAEAEATNRGLDDRIQAMDAQLAATKRELTSTTIELEQRQRALELAETQFAETESELKNSRDELAALRIKLVHAEDQLAGSLPASEAVRYRQTIAQLESRTAQLETALAARGTPDSLVAGRGSHAQVVGVGPQNAFVVINFGRRHGAAANQRLQVTRGADLLALVEISDSKENYSIAQVLPDSLSGKIRKGDAAALTP